MTGSTSAFAADTWNVPGLQSFHSLHVRGCVADPATAENLPPEQAESDLHVLWPLWSWYSLAPGLHAVAVLPSHRLPGAQVVHPTLPLSEEPAGQVLHVLWPLWSWYFLAPELHAVTVMPLQLLPGAQDVQVLLLLR